MSTSNRTKLFFAACGGMAVFGVCLALLGTTFGFPEMRERLSVDPQRLGSLSSLLITGVWVATVIAGPTIDRFGNKLVLAVSSYLAAASLVAFAYAGSFGAAAAASFVLGFGGGGLNTSTNALVSDLYDRERGSMLNVLGIFFGVGGLGVPLAAASLHARFTIPQMMLFAASMAFLCALGFTLMSFPAGREAHSFSLGEAARMVTYPGVLLFSFLLFFESANEQVVNTFTSTWIGAAGAAATTATYGLAAYQAMMMVGRIIAAPLLKVVSKRNVVIFAALGAMVATSVLLLGQSVPIKVLGAALIGLTFAPIYPTVLAIAGDRYQRFAGTVFGILFSIALIGAVISPSVAGHTAPRLGPVVPLVGAVMIFVLALVATRVPAAEKTEAAKM
jgi:FHS family glucose/mannose:H+ symporter-like MFS transporter